MSEEIRKEMEIELQKEFLRIVKKYNLDQQSVFDAIGNVFLTILSSFCVAHIAPSERDGFVKEMFKLMEKAVLNAVGVPRLSCD